MDDDDDDDNNRFAVHVVSDVGHPIEIEHDYCRWPDHTDEGWCLPQESAQPQIPGINEEALSSTKKLGCHLKSAANFIK